MIRVCLADDQSLVRSGIRALLEASAEVTVVVEAQDGLEVLARLQDLDADVFILDVRMPRLGGVETLQQMRALGNLQPVILLSTFDDDEALVAGIRAGAMAFVLKDVEVGPLLATLRRLLRGRTVWSACPQNVWSEPLRRPP